MANRSSHRSFSFAETIDSLIIFLNCSASYSIIPYVLFHQYTRGIFVLLIGFINTAYLICKYGKSLELPSNRLFYIYVIIMVWNSFAGLFSGTGFLASIAYLFMNTTFFVLLYNLYLNYRIKYSQKHSIYLIIRGYIWLILLCIASVILTFTLIKAGFNPYGSNISTQYDLFEDNISSLGHEYYAPFHLGVLLSGNTLSLRMPFFSEAGIICGIYHEPHVLTFMVFPCIFIMWAFATKPFQKTLLFISALLIMLMASSTTNILVTIPCMAIAMFYSKSGKKLLIPLFLILLTIVFYIGLENTDLFFIMDKLNDSGGSKGYTEAALKFAFVPKTIVGSNILNTSFIQDLGSAQRDAGIITIILNLIFLIGCYIKLFQTITADRLSCLIGIGVLYFFLHSMKTNMTTYTSSILLLGLFLINYTVYNASIKREVRGYAEAKENIHQ